MKRTCPFFFFSLIIDSAQGFLGLLLRCDLAQSVKEFHHPKIITIINNNYCYYLQAQMKTHAKNWFCFFWHHVLFCTSIIFIYINAAQLFVVQNFSSSKSFLFLKSFIGKGKKTGRSGCVCVWCVCGMTWKIVIKTKYLRYLKGRGAKSILRVLIVVEWVDERQGLSRRRRLLAVTAFIQ
jgi:hypothetical protein